MPAMQSNGVESELLAVIGGSGLTRLDGLNSVRREKVTTDFGEPSAELSFGNFDGRDIVFLARHGDDHGLPPHKINYRANIWALKTVGVKEIISVAAVGGITQCAAPGEIAIPDQLIDYTSGRNCTYYHGAESGVTHIDFSWPYSHEIRTKLLHAARESDIDVIAGGIYGCTNGPRLETAAEIVRMEKDGCDLVGMTGMPEASLAREAGLEYACCAVVANWAAGKTDAEITMQEIEHNLSQGLEQTLSLLLSYARLDSSSKAVV